MKADRGLELLLERRDRPAGEDPVDDETEAERFRRELLRAQARRQRLFIEALLDAMRAAGTYVSIDIETGEVMRPNWPAGQRLGLLVEHSAGCASHWHTVDDGFTCTCSPEIGVRLLGGGLNDS